MRWASSARGESKLMEKYMLSYAVKLPSDLARMHFQVFFPESSDTDIIFLLFV